MRRRLEGPVSRPVPSGRAAGERGIEGGRLAAGVEPPDARAARGGLTEREFQVAALIAEALGNRGIAERLGLSERTVTTHVTSILAKLNMTSRVQVIPWFLAREREP